MHRIKFCLLFFTIILIGCSLTPDQIIWTPKIDFGKEVLSRTRDDFKSMIRNIQKSDKLSHLEFVKGGVNVCRTNLENEPMYFCLTFKYDEMYNTQETTFQSRASSSYLKNLFSLSKVIASYPKVFEEDKIIGFCIKIIWKATNFDEDFHRYFPVTEDINFYISKNDLRDFAQMKITIQELSRKSLIVSSMGKMELDFSEPI